MRPGLIAPALATVVTLGSSSEAAAKNDITHGVADLGDMAVVAIVQNGAINCSGTLIAPSVVLTAAHCIYEQTPGSLSVVFGPSMESAPPVAVDGLRVHPAYDPATKADDLGLVHLASPAPVPPIAVSSQSFDPSFVGQALRLVGFGRTSADDAAPLEKHQGTTTLGAYDAQTFTFAASPSMTCFGDSGGPAFLSLGGNEYLAGVTSQGDPGCDQSARDTRVDPVVTSFLDPYVAAATTPVGAPCFFDANCARGTCFTPDDAPDFPYCSASCDATSACPAGMVCVAAQCLWPLPSPGALGSRCVADTDCEGELCAVSSGASVCSRLCFDSSDPCPSDFSCVAPSDAGSSPGVCLAIAPAPVTAPQSSDDAGSATGAAPPPETGAHSCSFAAMRAPAPPSAVAFGTLLWITRRRRAARRRTNSNP